MDMVGMILMTINVLERIDDPWLKETQSNGTWKHDPPETTQTLCSTLGLSLSICLNAGTAQQSPGTGT